MIFFDLETDNLLDLATKIHILCVKRDGVTTTYTNKEIPKGLKWLAEHQQEGLCAHNGINFDALIIKKLYPTFQLDRSNVTDTLVLAKLIYPDIGTEDDKLIAKGKLLPKYRGSQSLGAWGSRLGNNKGDYTGGWETLNQEMIDYCIQDVEVLESLYNHLTSKTTSSRAVMLEHEAAIICSDMVQNGFEFDTKEAVKLYAKLKSRQEEVNRSLQDTFKNWWVRKYSPGTRSDEYVVDLLNSLGCPQITTKVIERWRGVVVPKVNNKASGMTKGCPYSKVELTVFNPASRDHIANRLITLYNWTPKQFTAGGKPELNEDTIKSLKAPCKDLLNEYLMLNKRIGQIAEGKNAWLQLEVNGRMHGNINTSGAITGRCTHSYPNMSQIPAVGKPWGKECRSLFRARHGYKLVDSDLSGIEVRLLAHYMARYDKGDYAKVILEGDIHTFNQQAAGLPTRDMAKTFLYAVLYGAGSGKVGSIVGKGASEGKKLIENFISGLPAYGKLVEAVSAKAKSTGQLVGLDGRVMPIRHSHAALNTLLQSAGAVVAKKWLAITNALIVEQGLDAKLVAFIHDEQVFEVHSRDAEKVAKLCIEAAKLAGEALGIRIPIEAAAAIGDNFSEIH